MPSLFLLVGAMSFGASLAATGGVAIAQDGAALQLTGTWSGNYTTNRYSGIDERSLEVRITEQDGPLFRGVKSWKADPNSPPGSAGGALVTSAEESILGVVGFDGQSLHITEVGDDGSYEGQLVDEGKMELIYMESGSTASVYRVVLQRQP